MDLTVGLYPYLSTLARQAEHFILKISLEWLKPMNNHEKMRIWRKGKEIIITSFEFVLVQLLNGYGNVEKLLKVNPATFLLLAILFACNCGTILQFYDDSFKINELNHFICHS